MKNPKTAYRCDAFNGRRFSDRLMPADVIKNEILDYGNTDILETVNNLYCKGSNEFLIDIAAAVKNGDYNDSGVIMNDTVISAKDIARYILKVIKAATGKDVRYFLWLASLEAVKKLYARSKNPDIKEFDISDAVIVSDLEYDGKLYGYEEKPEPINNDKNTEVMIDIILKIVTKSDSKLFKCAIPESYNDTISMEDLKNSVDGWSEVNRGQFEGKSASEIAGAWEANGFISNVNEIDESEFYAWDDKEVFRNNGDYDMLAAYDFESSCLYAYSFEPDFNSATILAPIWKVGGCNEQSYPVSLKDMIKDKTFTYSETPTIFKFLTPRLQQKYGSTKNEDLKMFSEFLDTDNADNTDNTANDEFEKEYCKKDEKFRYMLLSRMQQDCEYYLGNGKRYGQHLWAGDELSQIKDMMSLWSSLSEKPEWLTLDQINGFSKEMTGKTLDELGYNIEYLKSKYPVMTTDEKVKALSEVLPQDEQNLVMRDMSDELDLPESLDDNIYDYAVHCKVDMKDAWDVAVKTLGYDYCNRIVKK